MSAGGFLRRWCAVCALAGGEGDESAVCQENWTHAGPRAFHLETSSYSPGHVPWTRPDALSQRWFSVQLGGDAC